MSGAFRRGKKYYYGSDVWDVGEDEARTSFRSQSSDHEDDYHHVVDSKQQQNDDYVASLLRRQQDVAVCHNSRKQVMTKPPPPPPPPPLPPAAHGYHPRMNRSGELDDILEESGDEEETSTGSSQGETSPPTDLSSGSPASSNSPQGSFRLMVARSSQESEGVKKTKQQQLTPCYSHKSQDSGFSDSGDSGSRRARADNTVSSEVDDLSLTNSSEDDERLNVSHVKVTEGCDDTGGGGVCSEVVHETRTNVYDHKQYHVSKVYFYSVSDLLNDSGGGGGGAHQGPDCPTAQEMAHVSILDCETGLIQRGYGQDARTAIPVPAPTPPYRDTLRSPQLYRSSPIMSAEGSGFSKPYQDDSFDSEGIPKLDPYACEMVPDPDDPDNDEVFTNDQSQYYFMEHKPLLPPKLSVNTPGPSPSHRILNGTSSLGRPRNRTTPPVVSPVTSVVSSTHSSLHSRTLSGSLQSPQLYPSSPILSTKGSGFPKTNGSLYESLSLGRPSSRQKGRPEVRSLDAFDDPMSGARSSFKSFESTMQRFSQIFNEIKCNR